MTCTLEYQNLLLAISAGLDLMLKGALGFLAAGYWDNGPMAIDMSTDADGKHSFST